MFPTEVKEKRLSLSLSSVPGDKDLSFSAYDFTSIIDGFGNQMKISILNNRTLRNHVRSGIFVDEY